MTLEIVPHVGVGPIKLGMTRKAVRKAAKAFGFSGKRGSIDYYFVNSISVSYVNDKAEFIELSSQAYDLEVTFKGVDVFDTRAEDLLKHLMMFDQPDPELSRDDQGYMFSELILNLWEPSREADKKLGRRKIFATIGIGTQGYLERRKKAKRAAKEVTSPLDVNYWPSDELAAKHQEAGQALRKLKIVIRTDKEGEPKLVVAGMRGSITNDALKLVKEFEEVEALDFINTGISDEGLAHLADLTKMRVLWISDTNITGDGFRYLGKLARLEELNVSATSLNMIHTLTGLERLYYNIPESCEKELNHLAKLPKLKSLALYGYLTNKGMNYLGELAALESLSIDSVFVTDEGIEHLRKLKNLKELTLDFCIMVSNEAKAGLRKTLKL